MNSTPASRHVLVTGMHRSGTTWVGHGLARGLRAQYVHEPNNPHSNRKIDRFYATGLTDDQLMKVYGFAFSSHPSKRMASAAFIHWYGSPKRLKVLASPRAKVVKDPFAFFVADRLAELFGVPVVLCVRHPAGVVSSFQRLGWQVEDFEEIVKDAWLLEQLEVAKPGVASDLHGAIHGPMVLQTALLWAAMHAWWRTCVRVPYEVARHVDLHQHHERFTALLPHHGLRMAALERYVQRTSSARVKSDDRRSWNDVVRHQGQLVRPWERRMASSEIELVRKHAGEEAERWGYGAESW